jgi:peptidyl-prolyl cis-trans isomerase C
VAAFVSKWRFGAFGLAVAVAAALAAGAVQAQQAGPAGIGDTTPAPDKSPIVAEVEGHPIHLSEVGDVISLLPGGVGGNSFETLFPAVLQRLIERQALVIRAGRDGVAELPEVRRHTQEAADKVLEDEYLHRTIAPAITEEMLLDRYNAEIKGKPGPELVHAWAILVPTEDKAMNAIGALSAGANFASLARQYSIDSTSAKGGDLGFVTRESLSPEVAAVVFSLPPGAFTPFPVKTAAGWFVLKTESRGVAPTLTFAQARAALLEQMIRQRAGALATDVVKRSMVRVYTMAGKELSPEN